MNELDKNAATTSIPAEKFTEFAAAKAASEEAKRVELFKNMAGFSPPVEKTEQQKDEDALVEIMVRTLTKLIMMSLILGSAPQSIHDAAMKKVLDDGEAKLVAKHREIVAKSVHAATTVETVAEVSATLN